MTADEVHVWDVPVDDEADLSLLAGVLDESEAARAARLASASAAAQFVTLHAAARQIVGAYVGCAPAAVRWSLRCHCGSVDHGKPSLAWPAAGLALSLSHTADRGLVAITRLERIGVDVERQRPGIEWDMIAARFFSPCEAARLRNATADVILRQWVRREAVGKLLGLGVPPPSVEVPVDGDCFGDGVARIIDIDVGEGAAAAVAAGPQARTVKRFSWSPRGGTGSEEAETEEAETEEIRVAR